MSYQRVVDCVSWEDCQHMVFWATLAVAVTSTRLVARTRTQMWFYSLWRGIFSKETRSDVDVLNERGVQSMTLCEVKRGNETI